MTIYDVFFLTFSIIYLPCLLLKGKAHRDFTQRFGNLPDSFSQISASRPVWIHAVSVGEVLAVKNFIERLSEKFPNRKIVLSTTTKTGNAVAEKVLSKNILKFFFPLDFSFTVKRVADIINPSALLVMETEIWPNLITELSRRSIPVVLINGRISDKSFKGYRKIKFLFEKVLKKINLFCMQTPESAERIKALGAPADNVRITGNMKFDTEDLAVSELAGIGKMGPLFVAGSTHKGEDEIILDAYKKLVKEFKDLTLLIAPRHIERADSIGKLIIAEGFEEVRVSRLKEKAGSGALPKRSILILDTLGELSRIYGLATIVFMGGSLVKTGGHNPVEPALFAKPIVFGPFMFNFRGMVKSFLEENAVVEVTDGNHLFEALRDLLRDENKRNTLGANARKIIDKNRGATGRNIEELEKLTKGRLGV